ncbi:DUF6250 domain-containing protein [Pseudoduganella namucuonensis]|uniref:Rhamnogalacturonan endolyase n=1 Tax=Pseudoduganella namucuonensis TaxID=1035707 RepID=A0A1I7KMM6_9BURK|nr:DUF6250 domain-containing protein [Pseudoduganella namucuonensis]SFU98693.1 rhamnogalacturonan endolyase [Pseudoduganella namucuonensis]
MRRLATLALLAMASAPHAQTCSDWGKTGRQLHADDFNGGLAQWVSEFKPVAGSAIAAEKGKLLMDLAGDATLWFKPALTGDVRISYRRKVLMAGGANDRLSDMNQFWMASDPRNADLFTRDGTFSQYDSLRLYYAGIGGNTNTTTRFRKYEGNGERVLHADLADAAHLLQPNREYAIQIDVYQGCTRLLVDGREYFSFKDPAPLRGGHFGFRTTHSRQEISGFKVHRLLGGTRAGVVPGAGSGVK